MYASCMHVYIYVCMHDTTTAAIPIPLTHSPPPTHPHWSVVGIDLGTTFSVAAVNEHGRVRVINDTSGDPLVPSIVSFLPKVIEKRE